MHDSITVKEFTVKDEPAFRLRVKSWKCVTPSNLNSIEFIQESIKDGEVEFSSTYNFLLTDAELKTLANGIVDE